MYCLWSSSVSTLILIGDSKEIIVVAIVTTITCKTYCAHVPEPLLNVFSESLSVMSNSLQPLGLYCSWMSPGQNTGVGNLSLLQGIFPTQVSSIAGGFFTNWVIREASLYWRSDKIESVYNMSISERLLKHIKRYNSELNFILTWL